MDKELLELMKQLGLDPSDLQSQQQAQTQQTQQQTPLQPQQAQPQQTQTQDDLQAKLEYYREIGIGQFIAQNSTMPNFAKLFPIITQQADVMLMEDLNKGTVKEAYIDYLNEAKIKVIKELSTLTKDILTYTAETQTPKQSSSTPTDVNYKMKDFYNDYKKALIKTTAEGIRLEFNDGVELDNGKVVGIAEGEAPIDKKVSL